jgi:hypothetical protein
MLHLNLSIKTHKSLGEKEWQKLIPHQTDQARQVDHLAEVVVTTHQNQNKNKKLGEAPASPSLKQTN